MVFRTADSMGSIVNSHRGDELTNRHRVGPHFYFQPLSELLLKEFMALSHCPLSLRTSTYVEFYVDSNRGAEPQNLCQVRC